MDNLKRYNFKDDHGHPLENCQDYIDLLKRIETAESSLAAMRQRAEEAEASLLLHAKADCRGILRWQKATGNELVWPDQGNLVEWALTERDVAIARAERAEEALRNIRCVARTPEEADSPEAAFDLIERLVDEALDNYASPPADASILAGDHVGEATKMVGERCDTCQHDPDTCDRAECPAWGKSEEAKARILASESNRPLTDEEHTIVDAGYERGKRIMAEVKAEERERRLADALEDIISNIEDRLEQPHGDDHVNLTLERLSDIARAALAQGEKGE